MTAPFHADFMLTAMWTCALIGAVCGLLSGFVSLRGWALLGDALSHAVVPGVTLAYLAGLPFSVGAFASALLATGAITLVKKRATVREDAAIGVVFTAFFAIGLLLISKFPAQVNLKTIAFGNILAIAPGDVIQLIIIALLCLGVLFFKWRDLMLATFDPGQARAIGIPVAGLNLLLLSLLAAATVAALQAVGAVLVVAMLVTPGATARLLTDSFGKMLIIGGGIGALTGFVGAYASWFANGETGGCIVTLQTLVFLAVLVFAPRRGIIAMRRTRP